MLKPVAPLRLPVVVLAASGFVLVACQREAAAPAPPAPEPAPAPVAAPPPPALDRAALLTALDRAAAAYAAGSPGAADNSLAGRRFSVRLAFGCSGPTASPAQEGVAGWSWGPDHKTIRLGFTTGDWTRSALISGVADSGWEAVEGIWLSRPWMTADGCPAVPADPLAGAAAAASPRTAGLAAVFEKGGSRLGRRDGQAYTYVIRPEGDAPLTAAADGYRLLLEGRLAAFPDGRAVRCRAAGPDQRPVCVAAVQLDRVAFQSAAGDTLSEWRPG